MAEYYISPTGDDSSGDGSKSNPWQTVSHAVSNSSNGDTIYLLDGTYTVGDLEFQEQRSYIGTDAESVIVQPSAINYHIIRLVSSDTTFENITFKDWERGTGSDSYGYFDFYGADSTAKLNIHNCIFRDITILGDDGYQGCLVDANGYGHLNCEITGSVFYNIKNSYTNPTYRAYLFESRRYSSGDPYNTIYNIYNNTFYFNKTGNDAMTGLFIWFFQTREYDITVNFKNNIVYSVPTDSFTFAYETSLGTNGTITYDCTNNDFYGNIDNIKGTYITDDPKFVDASNFDFRLRPDSPCIDTGTLI